MSHSLQETLFWFWQEGGRPKICWKDVLSLIDGAAPKSLVKGSTRLMTSYVQSHLSSAKKGKKNQIKQKKKRKNPKHKDTNIPNLCKQSCSQAAALKPLNALSHSLAERAEAGVGVGLGVGVLLHFIRHIPSLWTLLILGCTSCASENIRIHATPLGFIKTWGKH